MAVNALAQEAAPRRDLLVRRDTIRDTVLVHNVSGSAWGGPRRLVEDLAIGVFDGPDEYIFGRVSQLAPDAHGGIYVFDGQVPALRYYDSTGSYVRTLGGRGAGPGEYEDMLLGVAVRPDGRMQAWDIRHARMNLYRPDGTPDGQWFTPGNLYTSRAMMVDHAGNTYLKALIGEITASEAWPIGFLRYDSTGALLDTIPPPTHPDAPSGATGAFELGLRWAATATGRLVVGVSGTYTFDIRGQPTVRVRKSWAPIRVAGGERREWERRLRWLAARQGRVAIRVARTKPAYRAFYPASDGRIWVHLYAPAEKRGAPPASDDPDARPPITWIEPTVFDVFEPDGTYLGEVHVPPRTSIHVFGDVCWGVRRGEADEQYVVRLRLDVPKR